MQYNSHKQELKDRIKKAASEMFFKNGIRQVRMDDIAHNLGISKRTLYEIYDNKEQLLLDVVKYNDEENVKKLTDFANQGRTAIEIMAEFYRLQMKRVGNVNPCFFEDLQGYSNVLDYLHKEKEKNRKQQRKFIDKAISDGYFMGNINYDIVEEMFTSIRDNVINVETLQRYGKPELFRTIIMVFLRGICTQKGVEQLDALMKIIDTQE